MTSVRTVEMDGSKIEVSAVTEITDFINQIEPFDKCDLCDYVPSRRNSKAISIHKDAVHYGVKHYCDQCEKVFTTRSNLLKHTKTNHEDLESNLSEVNPNLVHSTKSSTKGLKKLRNKSKTLWYDGCDKNEDHCPCCSQTNEIEPRIQPKSKNIKKKGQEKLMKEELFQNMKLVVKDTNNEPKNRCDLCEYVPSKPSKENIRIHKDAIHYGVKYYCDHCEKACSTRGNLVKHMKICQKDLELHASKNENLVNEELFQNTKILDQVNSNIQLRNLNDPANQCNLCDYVPSKPSKKTIRIHKEAVHYGIKHYCDNCKWVSTTRGNLLKHINKRHTPKHLKKSPKILLNCTICDFKTRHREKLQKHFEKEHYDEKLRCDVCSYQTTSFRYLQYHQRTHNEITENSKECFQCEICSFQSHSSSGLESHQRSHAKGNVKCVKCEHETVTKNEMVIHNKIHTAAVPAGNTKERIICENCGFEPKGQTMIRRMKKSYQHHCEPLICHMPFCHYKAHLEYDINHHLKYYHKNEKVHSCDSCEYKTKKKCNLKKHLQIVHQGLRINCQYCNKSYTQDSDLRHHLDRAHGIDFQIKNRKIYDYFTCEKCNYRNKGKAFNNHKCEPIKCTLCDFETKFESNIKGHMSKKHNLKFNCDLCKHKAKNRSKLMRHKLIHEGLGRKTYCKECKIRFLTSIDFKTHENSTVHERDRNKPE